MNKVKEYILNNKKKVLIYGVLFIVLLFGVIYTFLDYNLYKETIVKITMAENTLDKEVEGKNGDIEAHYSQELVGKVLNGDYKGKEISMTNKYTYTGAYDERYSKGDIVFVTVKGKGEILSGTVNGLKRDGFVALAIAILIFIVVLVSGRKGTFALVSLGFNIIMFVVGLHIYSLGYNIYGITIGLVIIFAIVSMLLISGFNKKSLVAILSIFISITISMLLFNIALKYSGEIEYWMMNYISNTDNLQYIFMSGVLLGGLGATMDVAISIAASIQEIVDRDHSVTFKALFKSGREIGYDIMGTMVNVLLFTFISGSIPMLIFRMKNGISFIETVSSRMTFEVYRFLIGSIGILVTVPVAIIISAALLRRKAGESND